jgi:hypothetical protein
MISTTFRSYLMTYWTTLRNRRITARRWLSRETGESIFIEDSWVLHTFRIARYTFKSFRDEHIDTLSEFKALAGRR